MKEAFFYSVEENGNIICRLCPRECRFKKEDDIGACLAYKRSQDRLFSRNYGIVSASNIDPIEKKPLYHFYPGSLIMSLGTWGCNLKCDFCQNSSISQSFVPSEPVLIESVVEQALKIERNIGVAFTYNEPFIWYEFVYDMAKRLKENDMKVVLVSNGTVNKEPLERLLPYVDAFNIDLKGFSEEFYKKICKGYLETVKENIKLINDSGKHLEITNLLITDENDDEKEFLEMVEFVAGINDSIPLHISRYFPNYKMKRPATGLEKMEKFVKIAMQYLKYVYAGNVPWESNTLCPVCDSIVIRRNHFSIKRLDENGKCPQCQTTIFSNV
ncbi:MAG: AmmeMemoRadiSam system radical SAM enzyme [Candidatus Muiribacterium halophilum]|uniref:AmmeMemoRadiSam system radical SAM enzyme n=1 Tax=Muiribacterium halophilum TaxID=2053465 RepID=A0A2N5ZHP5_MUIH1|nr:MAG: AmmeMemoRadiSam system radical SAM enzyme [Candidatus Muirbacterium halophilum]